MIREDYDILVTASHVHPDYCFSDTPATLHVRSDGVFCTHPKLGCSKKYRTMTDAVHGLFEDHACTAIRWKLAK